MKLNKKVLGLFFAGMLLVGVITTFFYTNAFARNVVTDIAYNLSLQMLPTGVVAQTIWSGNHGYMDQLQLNCQFNDTTLGFGDTVTAYKSPNVQSDEVCQSERRFCFFGKLSGSYKYDTCRVEKTTDIAPQETDIASQETNVAPQEIVIFDMISAFAPSTEDKTMLINNDTAMSPGSSCTLQYRYDPDTEKTDASLETTSGSSEELRQKWQLTELKLGNWEGTPSFCSDETEILETGGKTFTLKVPGPTSPNALTFKTSPQYIQMQMRSVDEMATEFGAPFFPSKETKPEVGGGSFKEKVVYLVSQQFDRVSLSDYDAINLEADIEPRFINVNTECVTGTPSSNRTQNCYDPNIHGSQFRIAFGNIQWLHDSCTQRDPNDPICKNHGKFIYATLSLFDERQEFHNGSLIQDRPTGSFIYRMDMRDFLPAGVSKNPLKVVGNRTKLEGDVLQHMKEAILEADAKRVGEGTEFEFPERLVRNGRVESDEEYLSHFSFKTLNIGYEVTGLSQMIFDVRGLTLTGIK